jgi:hypothetical protein
MQKVPPATVAAIREGKPLTDPRLQALRTFALQVVQKRGWLDPNDLEVFFAAGYDQGHVLEVLTWVSLKTLSNYANHIAKPPVDAAFSAQKWNKGSSKWPARSSSSRAKQDAESNRGQQSQSSEPARLTSAAERQSERSA